MASYIPWLLQARSDGTFDLDGRTDPIPDLGAFIDLRRDHGLWFLGRSGPFNLADIKNEGLPYRLYTEHPDIVPVGWGGNPVPTRTVDYLSPAFLEESRLWYSAVMLMLTTRLEPSGGNVVAVHSTTRSGCSPGCRTCPTLPRD